MSAALASVTLQNDACPRKLAIAADLSRSLYSMRSTAALVCVDSGPARRMLVCYRPLARRRGLKSKTIARGLPCTAELDISLI